MYELRQVTEPHRKEEKKKVLGIFSSEEENFQKITPWHKNQVFDFCAMVLFSNIYGMIVFDWYTGH